MHHTEALVPALQRVSARASSAVGSAAAVLCSRGPGSFTGLRIGLTVAKGVAAATGAAVVSVSTTVAFAVDAVMRGWADAGDAVLVSLDARRARVYAAAFLCTADPCAPVRLVEDLDVAPDELAARVGAFAGIRSGRVVVVGSGAELVQPFAPAFGARVHVCPSRSCVLGVLAYGAAAWRRGEVDTPTQGPFYLREGEIGTSQKRVRFG